MVFGLLTSPIRMIFSLLLMQGISLTMFRAFLNQAIQRVDPLRFQFNLGNTNFSATTPSPPAEPPLQTLLQTLMQQNNQHQAPTPTPLVDQRVIDLVQLIRTMQPTQSPQSSTAAIQLLPSPPTVMTSPVIALNPNAILSSAKLVASPTLTNSVSASNYPASLIMLLSPQVSATSSPSLFASSSTNQIDIHDENNAEIDDSNEHWQMTTTPKPNFRKKSKKKKRKRKDRTKSETKEKSDLIVFEAVANLPLDLNLIGNDEN